MPRIFISYRRTDSSTVSGRIYDHLVREFGDDSVFKDVYDIPAGSDFRQVIHENIYTCTVQLVIIGTGWVDARSADGARRLDNPDDFVRIEVETGLTCPSIRLIPVLVSGAPMPTPAQLPESIRDLTFRNAVVIRDDPDFRGDIHNLIQSLKRLDASQDPGAVLRRRAPLMAATALLALVIVVAAVLFTRNASNAQLNTNNTATAAALDANMTSTGIAAAQNTATAIALVPTTTLTPSVTPTEAVLPPTPSPASSPAPTAAATSADEVDAEGAVAKIREGDALQSEGNYTEALDLYSEAIALDPNNAEAYISRASVLRTLGVNLSQALSDAATAYRLGFTSHWYHDEVARIYFARGEYSAAVLSFTRALQMETYALGYLGRAYAYHALGDNQNALSDANQAVALDPSNGDAYEERAWVELDLGRNGDAVRDFTVAIERNPDFAPPYIGRGSAYRALRRYDEATADFDRAIELDPNSAQAYYERGYTYQIRDNGSAAADDYVQAVALDGEYVEAYRRLVELDLQAGNPDDALERARRVVELAPDDPESYAMLGDVYYYVGRYDDALVEYQQYVKLAGDTASQAYLLRIDELESGE